MIQVFALFRSRKYTISPETGLMLYRNRGGRSTWCKCGIFYSEGIPFLCLRPLFI